MRLARLKIAKCMDVEIKHDQSDRRLAKLRTPHLKKWTAISKRDYKVTAIYTCEASDYLLSFSCIHKRKEYAL